MTIPKEFKKYFWDTDFDSLDIQKNKKYIISRLYNFGDIKEIKWLKKVYSSEDIREVALKSRSLKPIVANYLCQQFKLNKEDMAYYKTIKANNYEWGKIK